MSKSKTPKKKVVTTKSGQGKRPVLKTGKRQVTTQKRKVSPTVSKIQTQSSSTTKEPFLFHRQNYLLMAVGAVLIGLGMVLMIGGSMPSPEVWEDSRIYSFRIVTLAPFLILSGLVVEIFAIFKK